MNIFSKTCFNFSIAFLLFFASAVRAEKMPVLSWEKDVNGVTLKMDSGTLRLAVCSDTIIRILYSPLESIPPRQDVVQIKQWASVPFTVNETPESVSVKTKSLKTLVDKGSGAVSFYDPSGKEVLSELQDGGRVMTPLANSDQKLWKTQQTFDAKADEYLYGMGQYQEGVWNWKGMPLELRQQNTQVVVPLLLSSRGYGLMWNNSAWSFFNPCDTEIALHGPAPAAEVSAPKSTEELVGAIKSATNAISPNATNLVATVASTPKPKPTPTSMGIHIGTFTPQTSGDYVFFAANGNRSGALSIEVDGNSIEGITNIWTPYAISGVSNLKAGVPVALTIRGGGDKVTLSVRPKQDDRTVFRSTVGEVIDYTFFYGPNLNDVISGYREATGATPLLPRWAYGFWQCRERYASSQELLDAVDGYRSRHIPMDLIVQDWQYWGKYGWGAYQWDEKFYPDPKALIQGIHDRHAKFMISVWPNPHGKAGDAIKSANGFINGGVYDATNPDIRALRWKFLNDAFFSIGTDSWWQDAAEPLDDGNPLEGSKTFIGLGKLWRNAYPLFHSQCIYEGQRATNPNKRVCNLTRSGYLGQQRYGSVTWSGDINGDWTTFRRQITAGLNFCMAGLPYWTTDTGGFFRPGGGQYTSPDYNELLSRWFEWSTFCPVLRIHGYETHTEIWNWLAHTQNVMMDYDKFRYRMLPYNYSVAWQVTSKGETIMKALPLDFANDPAVLPISDEYCFGSSILVAPVTKPKADHRKVYLPKGCDWYDFWSGEKSSGGYTLNAKAPMEQIPLFVKAGSILPLGPEMEWNDQKPCDPIELRIYPGADGSFTLYEDAGDSYRYEKGESTTIPISWNEKNQTLTISERKGSYPEMLQKHTFHIVWVAQGHGTGMSEHKADQEIAYKGEALQIKKP